MEIFTVKQVSEIMGISPYTLRFYDKEGLFPDLKRGPGGRRHFSKDDLGWVYVIQCFRDTGLSIADIREYVEAAKKGESTVRERYEFIVRQKKKVMEALEVIRRQMKTLDRKAEYYSALMRGESGDSWLPDIDSMIRAAEKRKKEVYEKNMRIVA